MGRYLMKVQDCDGQERYVDVPHLWSVELDERIFDVDPPSEWHFRAGQRLTLFDDDLGRWAVEVVEDSHEEWELPCRILGPSFMVERYGRFYDGVDVVLDVPRQRLIDPERLAALDRVEEVADKLRDPKTGLLRKLSLDECQEAMREITAVRESLLPLFGEFVPYDSHVGHYLALCDQLLWELERWQQKMPKQISLFGGTVEAPKKKVRAETATRAAPVSGQPAAQPPRTEQLMLFG